MKLRLALLTSLIFAPPLWAAEKNSFIAAGPGISVTTINQKIPGFGASPKGTSLQLTYLNVAYQQVLTNTWALALTGSMGTELFRHDGANLVPDNNLTIYETSLEVKRPWGNGVSLGTPKNFSPILSFGLNAIGLPVLGLPQSSGPYFTIERLQVLSPLLGVGTGLYFSNISFFGSVKFLYPALPMNTKFDINTGYSYSLDLDTQVALKSLGALGLTIVGRTSHMNFDSRDPVSHTDFNNKYFSKTWGLKLYYRLVF